MSVSAEAERAEFAVLVPIVELTGKECVLLTERPAGLRRYAGQICFPGGAREPSDRDLCQTALRETAEEIGLAAEKIEVFAELDWFATRGTARAQRGHRVKPFVGRVSSPFEVLPDPVEVKRVLFVPTGILRQDPFTVRGDFEDAPRTVYTMQFDGAEIWGLTARILRALFVERDAST